LKFLKRTTFFNSVTTFLPKKRGVPVQNPTFGFENEFYVETYRKEVP